MGVAMHDTGESAELYAAELQMEAQSCDYIPCQ